ncbi:flagellar hook-basal body complex protein FliE [Escherichia coli]
MSITTINSTMQAQIMQDVQRMQANAQAPVLPSMTFSSTDPDVSFNRIMYGALGHVDQFQQASLSFSALVQVRNKIATGFNDLMSMSI